MTEQGKQDNLLWVLRVMGFLNLVFIGLTAYQIIFIIVFSVFYKNLFCGLAIECFLCFVFFFFWSAILYFEDLRNE